MNATLRKILLTGVLALLIAGSAGAQTLGPGHTLLLGLSGRWETTVRMQHDDTVLTAAGGARTRTILDGRFLLWEDSTFAGRQFVQGAGLFTYHDARDEYELTWAESGAGGLLHLTGKPDSARTLLTLRGDGAEWTIHVVDGNHLSCLRWDVAGDARVLRRETIYVREGARAPATR